MASPTVVLRGLVKDAIEAAKTDATPIIGEALVETGFSLAESYLPSTQVKDVPEAGQVWIVALAKDDGILTRGRSFQSEIPIQVAFQKLVKTSEGTGPLDTLVELSEQLRKLAKQAVRERSDFAWLRNEALRDGNGTPYHFTGLRDRSTFESYFTAFYQVHEAGTG